MRVRKVRNLILFTLTSAFGFYLGKIFIFYYNFTQQVSRPPAAPSSPPPPRPLLIFSHNLHNCQEALWIRLEKENTTGHLYFVTPTVRSTKQLPDLIRTAQALLHLRESVTWLVYEDAGKTWQKYPEHLRFLKRQLKDFTNLMDVRIMWSKLMPSHVKVSRPPKGVEGRLDGIEFVRTISQGKGVIFFGDDDNTYDPEIFQQMLTTKKISAWPVGLVTPETRISTPVVSSKNGTAFYVYDGFRVNRRFPLDFAGFAISTRFIIDKPKADIPYTLSYGETVLLSSLGLKLNQFEILASGATEILAFHSNTVYIQHMYTQHILQDLIPQGPGRNNLMELYGEYSITRNMPEPLTRTYSKPVKTAKKSTKPGKPTKLKKSSI